ncbi:MAG: THUMP domain-containing protein [Sphingobacteriales bacterium]|jgi:putative N6-adenine-specific DNA methylase|nr:THUMP domain-containing protein [Sphingobacteriales bacterium]
MVAKTQFGLEEVLATELRNIGATDVEVHNRAVSFTGDLRIMYKANLWLRTALKVLLPIEKFRAKNETQLYDGIKKIKWDDYLDKEGRFVIRTSLKSDFFNHSQYVSLKSKDAIADQFRDKYGIRPSVDLTHPDLSIDIHINKDEVTVSLDSSAESLHRRGYRTDSTLAPINEVTAAGMILLTGWNGEGNYVDPMCGSGTLLIEAAMIAKNMPPNLNRAQFGFERWKNYDPALFAQVREEAVAAIRESKASIFGSDKTFKAIEISRENITRAGLDEDIKVSNKRFEEVKGPEGGGIMIINPPYGERLPIEEIGAFYKMMGDQMKKEFNGYDVWVISSNIPALKMTGLAPSKKIMLYNGALECRFHKFEIYKGSRREKVNTD